MNNNSTYCDEGGIYDIRILVGIANLTLRWVEYRDDLFNFAVKYGDNRWHDREEFRQHMYREYFAEDTPITLQMYRLDPENQQIVLSYIKNVVMEGLASWHILF